MQSRVHPVTFARNSFLRWLAASTCHLARPRVERPATLRMYGASTSKHYHGLHVFYVSQAVQTGDVHDNALPEIRRCFAAKLQSCYWMVMYPWIYKIARGRSKRVVEGERDRVAPPPKRFQLKCPNRQLLLCDEKAGRVCFRATQWMLHSVAGQARVGELGRSFSRLHRLVFLQYGKTSLTIRGLDFAVYGGSVGNGACVGHGHSTDLQTNASDSGKRKTAS